MSVTLREGILLLAGVRSGMSIGELFSPLLGIGSRWIEAGDPEMSETESIDDRLSRFQHLETIEGDYLEIMTFFGSLRYRGSHLYAVRPDLSGGVFGCDDIRVIVALRRRYGVLCRTGEIG